VQAALRGKLGGCFAVTTGTHTAEELVAHGCAPDDIAPGLVDLAPRLLSLSPTA
jgi:hypothetical protein